MIERVVKIDDRKVILNGANNQMRAFWISFLAAISFLGLVSPASAEEPLPLSEYGKLPDVEDVAISPSGKRIATLMTANGRRLIVGFEGQAKVIGSVAVGDIKVRYIRWIGDDRILIVSSQTEDLGSGFTTDKAEIYVGRVIPMGSNAKSGLVFANQSKLVDAILGNYGIRQINGKWYGYFGAIELKRDGRTEYVFDHGRPSLYRVNLEDFTSRRMAAAARPGHDNEWLIGANGEVAATFDIDEQNGNWNLKNSKGKRIAEGKTETGRVGTVGLGKNGDTVIMSETGPERSRWFEVPLAGGEPVPFLPLVDFDRLYFDDATGFLSGYLMDEAEPKPVFFDKEKEKSASRALNAFGEMQVRMLDWTSDLGQVLVRTSGGLDSGTIFAVDIANSKADAIAYERRAIEPKHVGPTSTFEYTASDGMEMDGILTLPPGREAKNLPLVMLPHGGPHAHDTLSFDWWAQAFASRGYAVFQPNFRGSTNRGGSFRRAGYGEWGRKMQTDKSDGLEALAEAGIVDPERVCIVGASYGGYAALAGVTLQQDVYRCAVAVAPVSDIRDMYNEDYRATGRDRTTKAALLEQLGPRDRWDEVSPLRVAEKASAPIMLIHGKDDIVVPYRHSAKMADKLKDHKKPFEMVTLDGEDHWLSLSTTRQKMLEKAVGFVQRHNPAEQ